MRVRSTASRWPSSTRISPISLPLARWWSRATSSCSWVIRPRAIIISPMRGMLRGRSSRNASVDVAPSVGSKALVTMCLKRRRGRWSTTPFVRHGSRGLEWAVASGPLTQRLTNSTPIPAARSIAGSRAEGPHRGTDSDGPSALVLANSARLFRHPGTSTVLATTVSPLITIARLQCRTAAAGY